MVFPVIRTYAYTRGFGIVADSTFNFSNTFVEIGCIHLYFFIQRNFIFRQETRVRLIFDCH